MPGQDRAAEVSLLGGWRLEKLAHHNKFGSNLHLVAKIDDVLIGRVDTGDCRKDRTQFGRSPRTSTTAPAEQATVRTWHRQQRETPSEIKKANCNGTIFDSLSSDHRPRLAMVRRFADVTYTDFARRRDRAATEVITPACFRALANHLDGAAAELVRPELSKIGANRGPA